MTNSFRSSLASDDLLHVYLMLIFYMCTLIEEETAKTLNVFSICKTFQKHICCHWVINCKWCIVANSQPTKADNIFQLHLQIRLQWFHVCLLLINYLHVVCKKFKPLFLDFQFQTPYLLTFVLKQLQQQMQATVWQNCMITYLINYFIQCNSSFQPITMLSTCKIHTFHLIIMII